MSGLFLNGLIWLALGIDFFVSVSKGSQDPLLIKQFARTEEAILDEYSRIKYSEEYSGIKIQK